MRVITFKKQAPLNSSLDDFLIIVSKLDEETKQLVEFSVLQITNHNGKIFQIIKYDTEHGYCHAHRYYNNLKPELEPINKTMSPRTFLECKKDILENWQNG